MADRAALRAWGLVLDSQGIAYEIQSSDEEGWVLVVDAADAGAAEAALRAYAAENAAPTTIDTAPRPYTLAGLAAGMSAALVGFHVVTGPWSAGSVWFAAGDADSARVLSGEVWRVVTSLTLHADGLHVAGNALALALLGSALISVTGTGVGLWLILASGAVGNALNAAVRGPGHGGVGASTAVFGVVGALAGLELARRRRHGMPGGTWTPLVAGVLLLLLLGTGAETDVLAHMWGFVVGAALAWAYGRSVVVPPPRIVQWALTGAGLAAVAACWWLALA